MSLIHNEQTKLTATALNNVAVAFLIAGIVAPLVTHAQQPVPPSGWAILLSLAWLLSGFILHVVARLTLRRLKP